MIARCLSSQALSADEVVAGLDGPLADPHLVVAVAHHGLAALAGGAQGFLSGGGAVFSVCKVKSQRKLNTPAESVLMIMEGIRHCKIIYQVYQDIWKP